MLGSRVRRWSLPTLLNMSKGEIRWAVAKLITLQGMGLEEDDIASQLGLDFDGLEKLRREMYAREEKVLYERDNAQIYIDYVHEQRQCISDLDGLLEEIKNQPGAAVSAIRAKSDIVDRIVQRGIELGFVEKSPEKHIVGGLIVADLSNKDLQAKIFRELSGLDKLRKRFGGDAQLLDVNPGELHRLPAEVGGTSGATVPLEPVKLCKRPKRSGRGTRVHKGRRIVKEKLEVGQ